MSCPVQYSWYLLLLYGFSLTSETINPAPPRTSTRQKTLFSFLFSLPFCADGRVRNLSSHSANSMRRPPIPPSPHGLVDRIGVPTLQRSCKDGCFVLRPPLPFPTANIEAIAAKARRGTMSPSLSCIAHFASSMRVDLLPMGLICVISPRKPEPMCLSEGRTSGGVGTSSRCNLALSLLVSASMDFSTVGGQRTSQPFPGGQR